LSYLTGEDEQDSDADLLFKLALREGIDPVALRKLVDAWKATPPDQQKQRYVLLQFDADRMEITRKRRLNEKRAEYSVEEEEAKEE
jgi:hypothetical protein